MIVRDSLGGFWGDLGEILKVTTLSIREMSLGQGALGGGEEHGVGIFVEDSMYGLVSDSLVEDPLRSVASDGYWFVDRGGMRSGGLVGCAMWDVDGFR